MADSIFIRINDTLVHVALSDIYYVEALKNYCLVVTKKETCKILLPIKQAEEKLPEASFCRVQRSYIVALEHIDFIRDNAVIIAEKKIPIGAEYRSGFWKKLLILNRNKATVQKLKESFFIRSDRQLVQIRVADILYLEGRKNYVLIKTRTETHQALLTLKQMEGALPETIFCRVQHSFIVAIKYISVITPDSVVVLKKCIPLSGIYKEQFLKRIDILQRGIEAPVSAVQKSNSQIKTNV